MRDLFFYLNLLLKCIDISNKLWFISIMIKKENSWTAILNGYGDYKILSQHSTKRDAIEAIRINTGTCEPCKRSGKFDYAVGDHIAMKSIFLEVSGYTN